MSSFDHLGVLYRDTHEYVSVNVAFAREALANGNPVLVVVPGENLSRIAHGLGDDASRVTFADMAIAGRNPGWILPGVLVRFALKHPGRRVCIIGEPIWPGRTAAEYPACVAHEALINAAFAARDAEILCPFDASSLDAMALQDALRTHPMMCDTRNRWVNGAFEDPMTTVGRYNLPLLEPAGVEGVAFHDVATLADVRGFVAGFARAAGLPPTRLQGLLVAVNELATNTIRHTGRPGRVAAWVDDGSLICQATDSGCLGDPLAGRIPAPVGQGHGHGLMLVNRLVDLVRVYTSPTGTTIRLHIAL